MKEVSQACRDISEKTLGLITTIGSLTIYSTSSRVERNVLALYYFWALGGSIVPINSMYGKDALETKQKATSVKETYLLHLLEFVHE